MSTINSGYIKIAVKSEIPIGKMKKFKISDKEILVANVDGKFYAINDKCTHQNTDLSQGTLEANIVTCPKHKSKFDVTTGKVVSPPKILFMHPKIDDETTYPVRVEGEDVLVKI